MFSLRFTVFNSLEYLVNTGKHPVLCLPVIIYLPSLTQFYEKRFSPTIMHL